MVFVAQLFVLALTAAATPILRRDAVTVENDITQKISPQIQTLYNDVQGFPASGLIGAITIDSDFKTLVATLSSANSDIHSAGVFSEADGISITQAFTSLTSILSGTLSDIQDQTAAWADLPGGQPLVLRKLQSLKTTFDDFAQALTAAEPADLVPSATSLTSQVDNAFASAIAAYSD
jgi:hypothetical protein